MINKKLSPDWLDFEYFIVKYHHEIYNYKVWHTSVIPEEELNKSGFLNNANRFRLNRIAKYREEKGKLIKYSDYGFDFLAFDEKTGLYHACQCKHYKSNKVTANDIGTFLAICMSYIKTQHIYIQLK